MVSQALSIVAPDSPEAGRLLAQYGYLLSQEYANYDGAQAAFKQSLEIAEKLGDATLKMRVLARWAHVDNNHLNFDFYASQSAMGVIPPQEKEAVFTELYKTLRDEGHKFSIGYVNLPWGVGPRVLEWSPQPMAFYPSALHTVRLR